jgi:hypothetical protein
VEKTLMRRRLMRRTTTKTAKDQKTSSRGDQIFISRLLARLSWFFYLRLARAL